MTAPIYRAKKIDSDEYIVGYLYFDKYIFQSKSGIGACIGIKRIDLPDYEIDPSTISIHFPDVLDSEGNKIFASLSEDGRGGDIMRDDEYYGIAKYKDSRFVVEYENVEECLDEGNFEVIGIQK